MADQIPTPPGTVTPPDIGSGTTSPPSDEPNNPRLLTAPSTGKRWQRGLIVPPPPDRPIGVNCAGIVTIVPPPDCSYLEGRTFESVIGLSLEGWTDKAVSEARDPLPDSVFVIEDDAAEYAKYISHTLSNLKIQVAVASMVRFYIENKWLIDFVADPRGAIVTPIQQKIYDGLTSQFTPTQKFILDLVFRLFG